MTRLAPAVRCAAALSRAVKMAGAFERDVDAELLVRKLRRILDRGHLDLVAADMDEVAVDQDFMRKTPVHAVETQQVSVGLDRSQIVDRDDLDVLAAGLDNRAQQRGARYVQSR